MKRIFTIIVLFLALKVSAQQVTTYEYFHVDDYLLNPAYAGIQNYYSARLGVAQKFSGIKDATPETAYLSLHSRVGQGYLFDKNGKINRFFGKLGNVAIGTQIYQYGFGPNKETGVALTYGYHLQLNSNPRTKAKRTLAFALTPRYTNFAINNITDMFDVFDPLLDQGRKATSIFSTDFGALFVTPKLQLGFAALKFVSTNNKLEVDSLEDLNSFYKPKFMMNCRYFIHNKENKNIVFTPMAAVFMTSDKKFEYFTDLRLNFPVDLNGDYDEEFNLDLGANIHHIRYYDPTSSILTYFKVHYKNLIFSYGWTYTIGDISKLSWGSNQFSLGYNLHSKKKGMWETPSSKKTKIKTR